MNVVNIVPIHVRHYLHSTAELSEQEKNTSNYITEVLQQLGVKKILRHFSYHSILAEIGSGVQGPIILFRCELDALHISESNDIPYKSVHQCVSHKCGHDGHMATMISFAQKLINNPPRIGKILLFFQSAEEIGAGAKGAMESHIFDSYNIDFVFAWHNIPGYPLGTILTKSGLITPCVESLIIHLTGKSCHAAEPQNGINPASTIAQIVEYLAFLSEYDSSRSDFFVATPIHITMGEKAYGTSAGSGTMGYTLRAWEYDFFEERKSQIVEKIGKISTDSGLNCEIDWLESFYANTNRIEADDLVRKAASHSQLPIKILEKPFEFGEDFGLFTQKYKGAMFGIGAGIDHPLLHSVEYDFPDDLIDIGSTMMTNLVDIIMGSFTDK